MHTKNIEQTPVISSTAAQNLAFIFSSCVMPFKGIWVLQSKTSQILLFDLVWKITSQLFSSLISCLTIDFFCCTERKPPNGTNFRSHRKDGFHMKERRERKWSEFFLHCVFLCVLHKTIEHVASCL